MWEGIRLFPEILSRKVRFQYFIQQNSDFPVRIGLFEEAQVLWNLGRGKEELKDCSLPVVVVLKQIIAPAFYRATLPLRGNFVETHARPSG